MLSTTLISLTSPAVAITSCIVNAFQYTIAQKRELRNKQLQMTIDADRGRSEQIVQERKDLYEENKSLRTDMRSEINRLNIEVTKCRDDANKWQGRASEWEEKYERELISNASLIQVNQNLDITIKSQQIQINSLINNINELKTRIAVLEGQKNHDTIVNIA